MGARFRYNRPIYRGSNPALVRQPDRLPVRRPGFACWAGRPLRYLLRALPEISPCRFSFFGPFLVGAGEMIWLRSGDR